jgi:2-polyprenyl-6-hydroxyphenyl methylase/3-demethylubiquinone-9 3-methyltransferase
VTSPDKFYDSIAGDFDRLMNPYDLQRRIEVVFDELLAGQSLDGLHVLDVGCGTGAFSLTASRRGGVVTSLDIGTRLLARARAKGVPKVVAGDAIVLPFADGRFDVVLSSECIEHTTDPRRAVAEMVRVLRPGGRLVVTCPNRFWHWSVRVANALNLRPYRGLENWPSWTTLEAWVEASGGTVVQHVGLHMFPFVLAFTHPLLRRLDRFGAACGPVFVNQALIAITRGGRL